MLSSAIAHGHDTVTLEQAIGLLALAGDLAMHQPLGQSDRTARLVAQAARRAGGDSAACAQATMVARLRQSGRPASASVASALQDAVAAEVAGALAAAMGLPAALESSLRQPFDDPAPGLAGLEDDDSVPAPVAFLPASVSLALVADAVELKLPWLAGHSRRVAVLAQRAAGLLELAEAQARLLVRAALLHSLGRVAIENAIWETPRRLAGAERDALLGAPYATARAAGRIAGLESDAQLAARAFMRPSVDDEVDMVQRVLAAAVVRVALCAPRPWRPPYTTAAAGALLDAQAAGGRLDRDAVRAVNMAAAQERAMPAAPGCPLSARELEVLRRISLGQRQREVARALRLSTGAVRVHAALALEKLGCATRPAATLRALSRGWV